MADNGSHDRRVSSLEEARRRKAEQERAAKRQGAGAIEDSTFGQRVFAVLVAAMAAGYIAWLLGAFAGDPTLSGTGTL